MDDLTLLIVLFILVVLGVLFAIILGYSKKEYKSKKKVNKIKQRTHKYAKNSGYGQQKRVKK